MGSRERKKKNLLKRILISREKMRVLLPLVAILAVELIGAAPHSGIELDPLKFLVSDTSSTDSGSFVSPSDVTHAFLSHPSPSPSPPSPSPPHHHQHHSRPPHSSSHIFSSHGFSTPTPLAIPDPSETSPPAPPAIHPMKGRVNRIECRQAE